MPDITTIVSDPSATHEELAGKFAAAWAAPSAAGLCALIHADCLLTQPGAGAIRGRAAAFREFARLIRWLRDIRGIIDHAVSDGEVLLIAFRLEFTLGGAPFSLPMVDRLVMRDGLIKERHALFDSLRFFLAVLTRPRAWLGYLRYLFG